MIPLYEIFYAKSIKTTTYSVGTPNFSTKYAAELSTKEKRHPKMRDAVVCYFIALRITGAISTATVVPISAVTS